MDKGQGLSMSMSAFQIDVKKSIGSFDSNLEKSSANQRCSFDHDSMWFPQNNSLNLQAEANWR